MRTKRDRHTPAPQQRWALLTATVAVLPGCTSMKALAGVPMTGIDGIAVHWAGSTTLNPDGGQRALALEDLWDSFTG
jgi:hypothetical protein